ncbi:hypothetical protein BJ742DRAFT_736486 [Cladochytrium replicatum]|nr:hypothetical protein BJ742DRAFT_736486 [Cladochytrium replicatum]
MADFQSFGVTAEKGEWKVTDAFTASNLLRNWLSPDTFSSRNRKFSPDFTKSQTLRIVAIVASLAPVPLILTACILYVYPAGTKSIPAETQLKMAPYYIAAVVSFVAGYLFTFYSRKTIDRGFQRCGEIVGGFAREDNAVGLNWVLKNEHKPRKVNWYSIKMYWYSIEVQVWSDYSSRTVTSAFQSFDVEDRHSKPAAVFVKM